jgi:hypothetical protein
MVGGAGMIRRQQLSKAMRAAIDCHFDKRRVIIWRPLH